MKGERFERLAEALVEAGRRFDAWLGARHERELSAVVERDPPRSRSHRAGRSRVT